MQYETPKMLLINLEAEDVITLSIGKDTYDPEIGEGQTNPWQS